MAAALAAVLAVFAEGRAQEVAFRSGAAELRLGGQLQLQVATTSCTDFPPEEDSACTVQAPTVDWFLRRVRLSLEFTVNDWIRGRFQPEFGQVGELDHFTLRDAWGRLDLNPAARVTIGNFKRPFDGFQMTGSTQILTVERDLDVPGVPGLRAPSLDELTTRLGLSEWDVGVMLDGSTGDGRFRYWLGTFTGTDPETNRDLNTEKQFVGRAQVRAELAGLPLQVAAAGALTDVPFTRNEGELAGRYFGAGELWLELGDFHGGPHLQAGLVAGQNPLQNRAGAPPDLPADEDLARMWAFQAIGAYRVEVPRDFATWIQAVEPIFRATRADPNRDVGGDEAWGLTPGVQVFFDGRNKVAVNWDVVLFSSDALRTEHSLKAQYQLHF